MNALARLIEGVLIFLSNLLRPLPMKTPREANGALGRTQSGRPFWLKVRDLATHLAILGTTGTGKSSLILSLIARDLKAGFTVVLVDLRGDLVRLVLALCDSLEIDPARITLFDLRERLRIQGYDPLSGAGEPYIIALHILSALRQGASNWGPRIEDVLRNVLLALVEAQEPLSKLEAFLYDSEFRSTCLERVTDQAVLSFWARYEEMSVEMRSQWAAPAHNKVTPLLAVPHLRRLLGSENPLDLKSILDGKGRILLASLAVDEFFDSAKLVGSLLVSSITREMMSRVNVPEANRNSVRLYIDEFETMASDAFEEIVSEGRRFHFSLVLSHQSLSQIQARLRSVLRNIVRTHIFFRLGAEDAKAIASELPEGFDAATLRSLAVGEAIVLRGMKAETVQFNPPERPWPDDAIDAYRDRILERLNPPSQRPNEESQGTPPANGPDLEDWL